MNNVTDIALRYIANRDHTKHEMINHLKIKGFTKEEIDKTIEYMIDLKYLDDYNYCIKYFNYSFRKGKGILRIKKELANKGVDKEVIDQAYLLGLEEPKSEYERGLIQAEKVILNQEITEKLMMKMARRLSSLGYSTDIIYKIILEVVGH